MRLFALTLHIEGRGFEVRRSELLFSVYRILPAALGPGFH
jgi:hypothetical protein